MPRRLTTQAEFDDFEQELVDQWSLALAGAGATDSHVSGERTTIVEFLRFVGRPLWTVQPADADRWLRSLRVTRGQAPSIARRQGRAVARFYSFLLVRYQGDIHALTGAVISQLIDEFNRPAKADYGAGRCHRPTRRSTPFHGMAAVPANGAQVPACCPGLSRRVAVAPGGVANQRDQHARHPRLAP